MRQVGRTLSGTDGLLSDHRVLICDRDRTWSRDVRRLLGDAGVQVVQVPFQAPNANADAERFVRSITHECLDRMVPLGERRFRRALKEFVDYYHRERNHQGLENRLIDGSAPRQREGGIRRRPRLAGLVGIADAIISVAWFASMSWRREPVSCTLHSAITAACGYRCVDYVWSFGRQWPKSVPRLDSLRSRH